MRLKYVLSEVLVGLWRNVTMTIAMIITMAVSLTMLGASLLLYLQVDRMKDVYYEEVEVIDLPQDQDVDRRAAATTIETRAQAATRWSQTSIYETKDAGVRAFKEHLRRRARPGRTPIKPESLPESFRVKLKDPSTFEAVRRPSTRTRRGRSTTIVDQKQLLEKVFTVLGSLQSLALIVADRAGRRRAAAGRSTRSRSRRTASAVRSRS